MVSSFPAFEVLSQSFSILHVVVSATRRKVPSLLSDTPLGNLRLSRMTDVCSVLGSYFISLPVLSPLITTERWFLKNNHTSCMLNIYHVYTDWNKIS